MRADSSCDFRIGGGFGGWATREREPSECQVAPLERQLRGEAYSGNAAHANQGQRRPSIVVRARR